MSKQGEEDGYFVHRYFSKFRNVGNNGRTFIINKYLRFKN